MTNERITHDGITYEVLQAETPEDREAKGLVNLAAHMRQVGVTRGLVVKRPRGKVLHMLNEYKGGKYYGNLVNVGRITGTSAKG